MSRTLLLAVLAPVILIGIAGMRSDVHAQPNEAERALQAAVSTLGGVPKAQCQPPVPQGTPCIEPVLDEIERGTIPRGIARFSVTYLDEPGSFVAFFGRTPEGTWEFWYGTQEQLSPLVTLPGDVLACTGIGGGPAHLFADGRSQPLEPLTRLRAEEFVLTHPGTFGTFDGQTLPDDPGSGWYRVSAPDAGWVPERDVTDAAIGDCSIHDAQYGQASARETEAAAMDLTGVVWTWQETVMNNDETFVPDDPNQYTIEFGTDGQVAGQADCNRLAGPYTVTRNEIALGPLATTRAACPPGSLGDRFTMQLQDVSSFFLRDGELFLELRFDSGTMRFAPAAANDAEVTGVVTYRERIALPPDAGAVVQLQDTSRADAPAVVIGEQIIEPAGQVPIPFAIRYRPSEIDPRLRYTVQARITDGEGRLLFINMTAYPVITQGNPTHDIEVVVQMVN